MKYQIKEGKEWEVDVCMWMKIDPPWKEVSLDQHGYSRWKND